MGRFPGFDIDLRHTLSLPKLFAEHRAEATRDLLVTLSCLHNGAEMVALARAYETQVGFGPNVVYQELLGLMISERQQEASDRLEHIRVIILEDHPIQSWLEQMAKLLSG